jgi:capsular polysaccharide biosynthesis protein
VTRGHVTEKVPPTDPADDAAASAMAPVADEHPATPPRPHGRLLTAGLTVVFAAVAAALAMLLAGAAPAQYTAESLVTVVAGEQRTPDTAAPLAAVWAQVGGSDAVLDGVADAVGADADALWEATTVEQVESAALVSVSVTTADADDAADWANAVAEAVVARYSESPTTGFALEQATVAQPPAEPAPTRTVLFVVAAAVLGGLVGLVAGQTITRMRRRRARAR